jgi:tetratricopeptide (TPR) repeat protein
MTPILVLFAFLALPPQDPAPVRQETERHSVDPEKARKEFEVGEFYLRKKSYAAAVSRFDRATLLDPKFADAWFRLGQAREGTGELQKAVEAYEKFVKVDPKHKKKRDAEKRISRLKEELK